jgi:hypothetical protein
MNYSYMSCCPKPGPLAQKIKKLSSDLKKCQQNSAAQAVCCDRLQCFYNAVVSFQCRIVSPITVSNISVSTLFTVPNLSLCPDLTVTYDIVLNAISPGTGSASYTNKSATDLFSISGLSNGACIAVVTAHFTLPANGTSCDPLNQDIVAECVFAKMV